MKNGEKTKKMLLYFQILHTWAKPKIEKVTKIGRILQKPITSQKLVILYKIGKISEKSFKKWIREFSI